MADKDLTIGIKTTADTSGAEKAEKSVTKVETAAATGGKSLGKMGQLANQASFQITDFTNQVSMGTSAITAFSQQAPQLIGAFQMAGIAAGPVALALTAASIAIPLVLNGVRALVGSFGESAGASEAAAERYAKASEDSAKALDEDVKKRSKAIDDEAEHIARIEQRWTQSKKAGNEYSVAVLENAKAYEETQRKIAEALGLKRDRMLEIANLEAIEEAKLAKKAQLELRQEQDRVADAEAAMRALNDRLTAKETLLADTTAELQRMKDQLQALQQRQGALRKTVAAAPSAMAQFGMAFVDPEESGRMGTRRMEAQNSVQELKTVDPMVDFLSKRVDVLTRNVEQLGGENGEVAKLADDATGATNTVADLRRAVGIKSAEIQGRLEAAQADLSAVAALDEGKAITEKIQQVAKDITANHAVGQSAIGGLTTAAADSKLIAEEMAGASRDVAKLIGQVQIGATSNRESLTKTIALLTGLQRDLEAHNRRLESLEGQRKQNR